MHKIAPFKFAGEEVILDLYTCNVWRDGTRLGNIVGTLPQMSQYMLHWEAEAEGYGSLEEKFGPKPGPIANWEGERMFRLEHEADKEPIILYVRLATRREEIHFNELLGASLARLAAQQA